MGKLGLILADALYNHSIFEIRSRKNHNEIHMKSQRCQQKKSWKSGNPKIWSPPKKGLILGYCNALWFEVVG